METPLVSVILPVYNGERYIAETIDSVLSQSYTNFELLVIDDGSNDGSADIIKSYQDKRIIYVRNEINLKLIATLNKAMKQANGEFIARLDADDICLKDRLKEQVEFLQKNPSIDIVGTDIWFIDKNGRKVGAGIVHPTKHDEICWGFMRRCCLYHPTVMFRKGVLHKEEDLYDKKFLHAEDYELWLRLMRDHRCANIDKRLVLYRIHSTSITQNHNREAIKSMLSALQNHSGLVCFHSKRERVIELVRLPQRIGNVDEFEMVMDSWKKTYDVWPSSGLVRLNAISYIIILFAFLTIRSKKLHLKAFYKWMKLYNVSPSDLRRLVFIYSANVYRRFFFRFLRLPLF